MPDPSRSAPDTLAAAAYRPTYWEFGPQVRVPRSLDRPGGDRNAG
jgi:hypothetical protein